MNEQRNEKMKQIYEEVFKLSSCEYKLDKAIKYLTDLKNEDNRSHRQVSHQVIHQ